MTEVDMDRMRKDYESRQRTGGDFVNFEVGETLVYIHPPCRADDKFEPTSGLNYVPMVVHYQIGKSKMMAASLDPGTNPIIKHPFVRKFLKAKNVKLTGECPIAAALTNGTLPDDAADESRAQQKSLWGMTVMGFRAKSTKPWDKVDFRPGVAFVGRQIYDGIMEAFFDQGNVSDPKGAILLKVKKTGGKDKRQTKYEVKIDAETLRKPLALTLEQRKALEKAMAEGGDCDLFRVAAGMIKSTAEVEAALEGVEVESDPDDDDEDEDEAKDEEDEEEEEEKPKKAASKPSKPSKKPEPEEEEDEEEEDEEEDEEDEEEDPPPKPAAKKSSKKPEPEGEEDEDEEDEEDEEEEEKPKKVVSKSSKPSKPAKPAKDEEEDEDLGLDELEKELEDAEDEDEEEEEKPVKKATKKTK